MKLDDIQSLPISVLKGALVTNPNDAEFLITCVSVDILRHEVQIELKDLAVPEFDRKVTVEWSTLKDWSIQLHWLER